ncbi:glycoside hydrolase family 31 [Kribbella flavida DSM 17836]|uniref:alpha-D-xyloside xylohydrolase n=1 Tax=Kribbella flavida (strain DSM 17836 / JCM 10339 / NBRC 14399) TaxID=479435 RepID=D2PPF6_KRIFD|nr:alpha-xylosidase [Kribbella flavida]ADB30918.1 glycoside hydrolase family 31 [Kribbella flavida DSM 17836]
MKFTDGYWQLRPGLTRLRPAAVESVEATDRTLVAYAPAKQIVGRGDTLNQPLFTVTLSSPAADVIGVRIEHHSGGLPPRPAFALAADEDHPVKVEVDEQTARLTSGDLTAVLRLDGPWDLRFERDGRPLTDSGARSIGLITDQQGRQYLHEQLALGVGETVYGLGERFGPLVKNGQVVDIWNADGGTSSEQAYKNVPFYLSSAGYGVLVDTPARVSFEVGSEVVSRNQFSVEGQELSYYVFGGPAPKDVLRRYTALTGRPARVPAWSMGLWLSTSFTTDYTEATTSSFVEGMAARDLPLSVFHFDCFWMRQFHWCDFLWDPVAFPDPAGMLRRLKERGLRVSLWINPYIAQRSVLFEQGRRLGYLLKRPDGSVWQWDMWQAGMAIVDFTNPAATAWFRSKLQALLDLGVDCFKTDFGERIPAEDVVWFDGSDPGRMHNYYPHLYNKAVFDLLTEQRGEGDAVLFARSATVGGQQFPVHWGGDCESTFEAMAESLRGGLSLAASGFGYWSHDIGGFEGTPDAAVFKRWVPFGLLSSHSRLHGSGSYRVPWAFDEEAVEVLRKFTKLKLSLMPYLAAVAEQAHTAGTPMMRPMVLEFPADPGVAYLERQYMLGPDLLVAPVMSTDGEVRFYLPEGTWTQLLTGERLAGSRWVTQTHGFDSLPVLVREGAVIAVGAVDDRPDYDWADGVELRWFAPSEGQSRRVRLPGPDGETAATIELTLADGEPVARVLEGTCDRYTVTVV